MAHPTNQPLRIACIGECMIEISDLSAGDGRARIGVAGDTLNTAIYLARSLPPGTASVSYLTALGPDQLSDRMLAFMAAEGLDTRHVARIDDKLPGLYAIELDPNGERSFRYWRNQSAARSMFRPGALRLDILSEFDVVYLSGITLAILPPEDRAALLTHLTTLKAAGRQIVFDSNYRPRLWDTPDAARDAMAAAWASTTIALPSLDDEAALEGAEGAQDVIDRLARAGAREIVVKRGAAGPVISAGGVIREDRYAAAPRVVDTTAAGDSFNAGYLAARLSGLDPRDAAQRGHALAMRVIGAKGAIVDL